MKHIDSRAELQSNNLLGFDVAYPTKQKIRHIRKIAPGTMPKASGLFESYSEGMSDQNEKDSYVR